jgi:HK97 family phage prohead protease
VVNRTADEEGRHSIEGCHPTRERALAQQRALYANEPSAGRQAIGEVEQMEIRRLVAPIQSKDITDVGAGEITGLAAAYGNVDYQDDMFEPGAFAKSAEDWNRAKSRLPLLDWHGDSLDRIIGAVTQLKSVPQGLWFRAGFTKDDRGQRARQLAKDGYLDGVSVGWLPIHQPTIKAIGGKAVQVIREARVHEISLTPTPANTMARLASVKSLEVKAVSDKPWSQFTEADYTLEQWRRACLISVEGATDTKAGYKLPVREPDGTLNRNAVHAAAGGHGVGAVQGISADKKRAAARALVGLYRSQLGEDPPPSLLTLAGQSTSSLDYVSFAEMARKALDIPHEAASKAAFDLLLQDYTAAGSADEPDPTATAAAATPPGPDGTAESPSGPDNASDYALSVLTRPSGPPDGAPGDEPQTALVDPLAALEMRRENQERDRLEAEIRAALGGAP